MLIINIAIFAFGSLIFTGNSNRFSYFHIRRILLPRAMDHWSRTSMWCRCCRANPGGQTGRWRRSPRPGTWSSPVTNAEGHFTIEQVPPGIYRLQATAIGYKSVTTPEYILSCLLYTSRFERKVSYHSVVVNSPCCNRNTDSTESTLYRYAVPIHSASWCLCAERIFWKKPGWTPHR